MVEVGGRLNVIGPGHQLVGASLRREITSQRCRLADRLTTLARMNLLMRLPDRRAWPIRRQRNERILIGLVVLPTARRRLRIVS